jgi:1-acyl-sn-glycerol-3-phosphate acyltransferase
MHPSPLSPPSPENTDQEALLLETVRRLAVELHPREGSAVRLDSSLDRDLGFDSLARVELLARLEKAFGIAIGEQVLAVAETPRDFLREIKKAAKGKKPLPKVAAAVRLDLPQEEAPAGTETLVDTLRWHMDRHPDRPHIHFYSDDGGEDQLTYRQLFEGAQKVAAGLLHMGLDPGEAAVIMLPTGHDYFFSFFGVLLAGGIPVPVYPPGHLKQIEEHLRRHAAIIGNCRAAIMIATRETVRFARLIQGGAPRLRNVVTVAELSASAAIPEPRPVLDADDTAFLQYTSGSTGTPKGVILTHANLLANIRAMGRAVSANSSDVFVSWLPLYHDMGLIGAWLGSLYFSSPLILMSPLAFIARPIRWLRAIHRFGGTLSAAPNFAYELCLRRITDEELEGIDLRSWRIAFNGAEAVSPATLQRFTDRFKAFGFKPEAMTPVYGLAESSVGLAFPPLGRGPVIDRIKRHLFMRTGRAEPALEDEGESLRFVNCGRPLPGHQIRIVDSQGRELPDRREGRLQFKGPSATSGYFRNPRQTGALFDGAWLLSGDRAYIADGDVYITGRSKDIIIRAGRNLYPEELEEVIGALDGVRAGNVAVFGSIDRDSGTERLIVLAESRKKKEEDLQRLRSRIQELVVELAALPPDQVVLAPPNTVLKTSSGKIRRSACRDLFEKGLIGRPGRAVWLQMARFALSNLLPRLRSFGQTFAAALYAGWCWLIAGGGVVLAVLALLLPGVKWRWKMLRPILRTMLRLAGLTPRLAGLENLPVIGPPCLFVANHASYLDSYLVAAYLPRTVSFVAKGEFRDKPTVRIPLERLGTLFVERFQRKKSVADAERLLQEAKRGRSLFFFAEGTITRMPGLLPFRMGAFETAVKGNLPIVPLAIRGTRSVLRAESWFPRHGLIMMSFGPPVQPTDVRSSEDITDWQLSLELRNHVRHWILLHTGEPDLEGETKTILTHQG